MLVNEILGAAGIPCRRSRFLTPPDGTYAVYTIDIDSSGADNVNLVYTYESTIELYEQAPDDDAETAIETALDDMGIAWEKQDRYWLQDEQLYQAIYEFTHTEKIRRN